MTPQPLESRVDSLEHRMTQLEQQIGLDDRDPSQVVPLRTEMRAEFSAVRGDMASLSSKLESLESKIDQQGIQMRVLHEEVISRIALIREGAPAPPRKPRKR